MSIYIYVGRRITEHSSFIEVTIERGGAPQTLAILGLDIRSAYNAQIAKDIR